MKGDGVCPAWSTADIFLCISSACHSDTPAKTGKRRCASVPVEKPGSSHAQGARFPPSFTPSTRLTRACPTAGRALPFLLCRPKSTGFSTEEQKGPPEGGRRRKRLRRLNRKHSSSNHEEHKNDEFQD